MATLFAQPLDVVGPGQTFTILDQPIPIIGPYLHLPWWVIVGGIVIYITMLRPILYWHSRKALLRPVQGYRDTLKQANPIEDKQVWLLSKAMGLSIEMLRYIDGIFSFYKPTNIQKWRLASRHCVMHCGGLPAVMVSDDYDATRDPVSEIALTIAMEGYNTQFERIMRVKNAEKNNDSLTDMDPEEVERLKAALVKWDIKKLCPINCYDDYRRCGREHLETLSPDGLRIPSFALFQPMKFSRFFPKGRSAGLNGRILIEESKEYRDPQAQPDRWQRFMQMAAIIVICILPIVAAWFVPLGGK